MLHCLLPVSNATAGELAAFSPHAPYRVVYNGVETRLFAHDSAACRDIEVLTVCGARDVRSAAIKGIEVFLGVAVSMPEAGFRITGLEGAALEYVRSLGVPGNVLIEGRVDRAALAAIYARTSVYCQFSRHESFGMALAEAMASGAVPVVTATGALPEVVGEAGWVVAGHEVAALAAAVRMALQAGPEMRVRARQRIVALFSREKRSEALAALVNEIAEP